MPKVTYLPRFVKDYCIYSYLYQQQGTWREKPWLSRHSELAKICCQPEIFDKEFSFQLWLYYSRAFQNSHNNSEIFYSREPERERKRDWKGEWEETWNKMNLHNENLWNFIKLELQLQLTEREILKMTSDPLCMHFSGYSSSLKEEGGRRRGRGTEVTHENAQNMKTFASRYAPKNRSHLSRAIILLAIYPVNRACLIMGKLSSSGSLTFIELECILLEIP